MTLSYKRRPEGAVHVRCLVMYIRYRGVHAVEVESMLVGRKSGQHLSFPHHEHAANAKYV